jgi:hypothetical protein
VLKARRLTPRKLPKRVVPLLFALVTLLVVKVPTRLMNMFVVIPFPEEMLLKLKATRKRQLPRNMLLLKRRLPRSILLPRNTLLQRNK